MSRRRLLLSTDPLSVPSFPLIRLRLLVLAAVAIGLLLYATQAEGSHRPGETLHVCADQNNGVLRVDEDCRTKETAHALTSEAGLQAAEARIATLEADNAALRARVDELETRLDIPGISEATASNTLEGKNSVQFFSFQIDDAALEDGATVAIDLERARRAGGLDYDPASFDSTTGSGSAEFVDSDGDGHDDKLIYTAGASGDALGATVSIKVTGLDGGTTTLTEFTVEFVRDATVPWASDTDTFVVSPI